MPPTNSINAVATSLEIIEEIHRLNGATATELADSLDKPYATIHYHLNTLKNQGYLYKDSDKGYHVGFKFLDIAKQAENRIPEYEEIRDQVAKIADLSGEIALFAIEEFGESVCVFQSTGEDAINSPVYRGERLPLHQMAAGKAILSRLPPKRVDEIVANSGLEVRTPNTVSTKERLRTELEEIRNRGIAFSSEELMPGLAEVAIPVTGLDDEVIGAISIIGPQKRIDDEQLRLEFPELLTRSVEMIKMSMYVENNRQYFP